MTDENPSPVHVHVVLTSFICGRGSKILPVCCHCTKCSRRPSLWALCSSCASPACFAWVGSSRNILLFVATLLTSKGIYMWKEVWAPLEVEPHQVTLPAAMCALNAILADVRAWCQIPLPLLIQLSLKPPLLISKPPLLHKEVHSTSFLSAPSTCS